MAVLAILISLCCVLRGKAAPLDLNANPVTGILGAFPEEISLLKQELHGGESLRVMGIEFTAGKLHGKNVVLACTGIGKVNASMTTTLLLRHFDPTEVIFTGIAGALNPDLRPGDIVIGEMVVQHDLGSITDAGFQMGRVENPANGKSNPFYFHSDPDLIARATKGSRTANFTSPETPGRKTKPRVHRGVIATGDVFVAFDEKASALRTDFNADAVETEGGAVAQVCHQYGVPFIVIRSISDRAGRQASEDMRKFRSVAAMNSAALAIAVLRNR